MVICLFAVLDYIPYGDMFTLWTFHGFFPELLVKLYVAELAMVLGKYHFHLKDYIKVIVQKTIFLSKLT